MPKLIRILLIFMVSLTAQAGPAAVPVKVIKINNFNTLSNEAKERQLPILLMVSATYCSYCDLLEAEIIRPMVLSGEYGKKVVIRKLVIDDAPSVIDFNGRKISTDDLMYRYRVYVTPTLLFLSPDGKELAERLVGINTVEMFGGLVDDAIDHSLVKMRAKIARLR